MSGALFADIEPAPSPGQPPLPAGFYLLDNLMEGTFWKFSYINGRGYHYIVAPLWAPLLVMLIPAGVMWRPDIVRFRRRRAGVCVSCGYDRSGLAISTSCPECGSA